MPNYRVFNLIIGSRGLITSVIFTLTIFSILGVLTFFIAKESPKGKYKSLNYTSLPGILTPRVLKSRENWIMAHQAMSPYFTLLAIYFSIAAVINSIVIYSAHSLAEIVFGCSPFLGIFIFSLLVFLGDRVVAKHEQATGSNQ